MALLLPVGESLILTLLHVTGRTGIVSVVGVASKVGACSTRELELSLVTLESDCGEAGLDGGDVELAGKTGRGLMA